MTAATPVRSGVPFFNLIGLDKTTGEEERDMHANMHTTKKQPQAAAPETERPADKCPQIHTEEHLIEEILRAAGLEQLD